MSSEDTPSRRHRQTRVAAKPASTPASQQHSNTHNLNSQAFLPDTTSNMNYPAQPTTPPRTPRRNNQAQNATQSIARENGSKQKSRNKKNKPQNVNTSPAVKGRDRTTPPLGGTQSAALPSSAKPMNTPSSAMFAGATFHASPAPSALPIPKFYSKSVPDSPGMKGVGSLQESYLSEAESPTPPKHLPSATTVQREESPLDFFFKADRAEKERARSASSSNPAVQATGPFAPPPNHRNVQTPPALGAQRRPSHAHRTSTGGSGMFAMELDGPQGSGSPLGPGFGTPSYAERINAAKNNRPREDSQNALERSEALKAYLFSDHNVSPPPNVTATTIGSSPMTPKSVYSPNNQRSPAAAPQSQHNGFPFTQERRANNYSNASGRSSGLRQEVTPTKTPTMTPDRNTQFAHSSINQIYGNVMNPNHGNFLRNSSPQVASPSASLSYGASSGNTNMDLQGMENSLRQILKLDSQR